MLVAEQRRSNQRQIDRRAKPARRSTRLRYPKTAAQRLHQSRSAHKNQNPQNGQLMARFDWGLGAVCFGASPVAAVFGSAPGSATPPEHRIHCKPASQEALLKQDISTLLGIGHFYFALTGAGRERCYEPELYCHSGKLVYGSVAEPGPGIRLCERSGSHLRTGDEPHRSEEHNAELQALRHLVVRLLLQKT